MRALSFFALLLALASGRPSYAWGAADADGDGVDDAWDNCPGDANPMQRDADYDLIGDVCDPLNDKDGDGTADDRAAPDNCPDTWNPGRARRRRHGWGDACRRTPRGAENEERS